MDASAGAHKGDRPLGQALVVCFDPIGDTMAGPAIRAWHLAEQLAVEHDVILVSTVAATRSHPAMDVVTATGVELDAMAARAAVVFAPVSVATRHPGVVARGTPLVVDLYIPTHLENLEPAGRALARHRQDVDHQVSLIGEDLVAGDFFVCASERQRDFWLGALAQAGRVNPLTARNDPGLRSLVDVVPFGLAADSPVPAGPVLRERFGIGSSDPVLIWGGGVYEWLDPLIAVRAVDRLRERFPAIHLVFIGMRNPNPGIDEMAVATKLRTLSAELGLTGRHVHFNESWLPYEDRGGWLLDADVAVSMHGDHLETRFSFRTRVLDYLWARRPMVLTGGDDLSDVVEAAGLGVAVAPGDVGAVVDGVTRLLEHPPTPEAFDAVAARYRWSTVSGPLLRWCATPHPAADRSGLADRLGAAVDRPPPGAGTDSLPPVPSAEPTDPARAEEEARAERVAPGYLRKVRDAAARLAVGPDRRGDLRASLDAVRETADVDVDAPTGSLRPQVRVVKTTVKAATGWYLRYVGQQVAALGHATVAFGEEVISRTDELGDRQVEAATRLAALEARIGRLETKGLDPAPSGHLPLGGAEAATGDKATGAAEAAGQAAAERGDP